MPPFEQLRVRVDRQGRPVGFFWRHWQPIAQVLEQWSEVGEWWAGEVPWETYRVLTHQGGVFEICRRETGDWFICLRQSYS